MVPADIPGIDCMTRSVVSGYQVRTALVVYLALEK